MVMRWWYISIWYIYCYIYIPYTHTYTYATHMLYIHVYTYATHMLYIHVYTYATHMLYIHTSSALNSCTRITVHTESIRGFVLLFAAPPYIYIYIYIDENKSTLYAFLKKKTYFVYVSLCGKKSGKNVPRPQR